MKNKQQFKNIQNNVQKEALINEIKGNLFEYLVSQCVARRLNVEQKFLAKFVGVMKTLFSKYESWLRENERDLLYRLPILADNMAQEIQKKISFAVEEVLVIGKLTAGFHNDIYKEADILILGVAGEEMPISIKLCKKNAYVSTKSGGARSFISKYFSLFSEAQLMQDTFNSVIDDGFKELGEGLYQKYSLDFSGSFDSFWTGPDLPGELDTDEKEMLNAYYRTLNFNLYNMLKKLYESDKELFFKSIISIMGQSEENLYQAICFHQEKRINGNKEKYHLSEIFFNKYDFSHASLAFCDFNDKISSFDISVGDDILQLRIKPMNKFTTPSYKINCSVGHGKALKKKSK